MFKENQFRIGPNGIVFVNCARGKIGAETLYHAQDESNGCIYDVRIILAKSQNGDWIPSWSSDKLQLHTIASILEKWPVELPDFWVDDFYASVEREVP